MLLTVAPWFVLLTFCVITWRVTPRNVNSAQFFDGRQDNGVQPSVWLVAMSAAITWVFAKSIANASDLAYSYGIAGGLGYTIYYLSFGVAGIAIYFLRKRGGYKSLPHFLTSKYGPSAAKLFMLLVVFRLINEIWSNTKVMALYFGPEGSAGYWLSVAAVSGFTVAYAWRGGMRASLTTDRIHIFLAFILLGVALAAISPGLADHGVPSVDEAKFSSGVTFCFLALVQILSYPFHDPVLTDRGFLNSPGQALRGFLLAGILSGSFIFLFSLIGLYGLGLGLGKPTSVSVPASFGLPMLMVFNAIMLMTGGSTIDSTLTSISKLAARDWRGDLVEPTPNHLRIGRIAILLVAVLGNLPLLTIYLGEHIGPAIIAATTISGTMVMGLGPIFLLSWIPSAGALSFSLAFWPGVLIGAARAVETFGNVIIFPRELSLGNGPFALDLGLNVWGLAVCSILYLTGSVLAPQRRPSASEAFASAGS